MPTNLYVMDDMQKIFLLSNEDDVKYNTKKMLSFEHHKKSKEVHALRANDWSHVHITERTLSFGNYTYNLNSELSFEITVPQI